jgi:hypothetical protein
MTVLSVITTFLMAAQNRTSQPVYSYKIYPSPQLSVYIAWPYANTRWISHSSDILSCEWEKHLGCRGPPHFWSSAEGEGELDISISWDAHEGQWCIQSFFSHTAVYCLAVKSLYEIRNTKVLTDRIENFVSERMMGYLLFHIRIWCKLV